MRANPKKLAKSCPPKLRALLKAVHYEYQKAADYAGLSKSFIANVARGSGKYSSMSPQSLEQVAAGLALFKAGEPPPARIKGRGALSRRAGAAATTAVTGFAVVIASTKSVEAVFDAGEKIAGRWVFKTKLQKGQWLLILHHEDPVMLAMFADLARLVADVVTP